jgi:RHS repeat-associated protein
LVSLGSVGTATDSAGLIVGRQDDTPWGQHRRTATIPRTQLDFTGQRRDDTGLLSCNARYYDPKIARFISADTIVPGAASGAGGGAATIGYDERVALAPLTVGFHEPGFAAAANAENAFTLAKGFFDPDSKPRTGPANPQALNRYSYVLKNNSSQSIWVVGSRVVDSCDGLPNCDPATLVQDNVVVEVRPGESSTDHRMADADGVIDDTQTPPGPGMRQERGNFTITKIDNDQEATVTDQDMAGTIDTGRPVVTRSCKQGAGLDCWVRSHFAPRREQWSWFNRYVVPHPIPRDMPT